MLIETVVGFVDHETVLVLLIIQVPRKVDELGLDVLRQVIDRAHVVPVGDLVLGILHDWLLGFLVLQHLVGCEVGESEETESHHHTFLVIVVAASEDGQLEGVALVLELQTDTRLLEFAQVLTRFSVRDTHLCLLRELVLHTETYT